nr:immunoglobulin light chain junction region [Macaca mulatta]
CQQHDRSPPTF